MTKTLKAATLFEEFHVLIREISLVKIYAREELTLARAQRKCKRNLLKSY